MKLVEHRHHVCWSNVVPIDRHVIRLAEVKLIRIRYLDVSSSNFLRVILAELYPSNHFRRKQEVVPALNSIQLWSVRSVSCSFANMSSRMYFVFGINVYGFLATIVSPNC